jgi:hypothetical protein
MSVAAWQRRSIEERTLLNPAFVGRVIGSVASGYASEAGEGLPFPLTFLAVPAALHAETRRALPTSIRTSLTAWALQHPYLRESLGVRARAVAPAVREGLLFALKGGGVSIDDEGRIESVTQRRPTRPVDSDEVQLILSRARFVGRWFAHAGDVATIYAIWGVRP